MRLETKVASADSCAYFDLPAGEIPISIRVSVSANLTYFDQAWYRNAAGFCTSDTFNLSQGVSVLWIQ